MYLTRIIDPAPQLCVRNITFSNTVANWQPIPAHPEYEASRQGEIRHVESGKLVRQNPHNGYWTCKLGHVHRLIMSAFLGRELTSKELVLHHDDDGLNNELSNLKIGNAIQNILDRRRNDRAGYKLRKRDVCRIRADIAKGKSDLWIANKFKISESHVRNIRYGNCYGWL